jgi:NAD(P)-dependent dehydrogenase (short-subunit alcohol dehydrogenase family)
MRQRVFVTGAVCGIGLEIARAFSAAGATVVITDICEQALAAARRLAIPHQEKSAAGSILIIM